MKKLVYSVGQNDWSRPARLNSKSMTKEYDIWTKMLQRCFSEKYQTTHPTYKGCSVSENFLNYTFFYDWCQEQVGFGKQGWQLDKDILIIGNKTYSENACVFVPREINNFFTAHGRARGEHPLGVYLHKNNTYKVQCAVNGKQKHLGLFNTPQEAFAAYKPFKEALCKQLALKWESEIDVRLFNAMMNWVVI